MIVDYVIRKHNMAHTTSLRTFSLLPKDQTFIFYLNTRFPLARIKTETFNCCCLKLTPILSGRWCGLLVNCLIFIVHRICIAAYWILYSEFGLVSCIDLFFDVSDGQFRCKMNRTSSKFTALDLNIVERSEDLSN